MIDEMLVANNIIVKFKRLSIVHMSLHYFSFSIVIMQINSIINVYNQ